VGLRRIRRSSLFRAYRGWLGLLLCYYLERYGLQSASSETLDISYAVGSLEEASWWEWDCLYITSVLFLHPSVKL
jgi:hypothetical protein